MKEGNEYLLPSGRKIHHLNKHETDFLCQEIFINRSYAKALFHLSAEPCIFDVGANIGMFSMFAKQEYPQAALHAFEPIPSLHQILSFNLGPYGQSIKTYPVGLSDKSGEVSFVYYPGYSIMSGLRADENQDTAVLSSSLARQITKKPSPQKPAASDHVRNMARFILSQKEEIKCHMKTMSEVIREENIQKIDLLKIDVEKAEMDVLKGIQENDWAKIKNIVLEVHSEADLRTVRNILVGRGYTLMVEQAEQLSSSGIFNCFAKLK